MHYYQTLMLFYAISIIVPLFVYAAVPGIVHMLTGKQSLRRNVLTLACFLFFISWYLPSPLIQGEQTAFVTHFVGGGMFCALLWLSITRQAKKHYPWFIDLAAVYALVSALGVANELFELAINQLGITGVHPADAWWDLLANTSGAVLTWIVYRLAGKK